MAGNAALLAKSWPKIFKWQPSRKSWGGETYIYIDCAACLHGKSYNTLNKNAHSMYDGDCDAAIARAAAAVTLVQSQSQEVGSGDERLGLLCFDLSSAQTDFWWLQDEQ